MNVRAVRLPDRFYLPRTDPEGREVRDQMPWEGAVSYATDGERLGIQYADGEVVWLGLARDFGNGDQPPPDPVSWREDFAGVNLDALVEGMKSYMDLHPILRTVWRQDIEELDALRRRSAESHP
jgi:hypothetical protein